MMMMIFKLIVSELINFPSVLYEGKYRKTDRFGFFDIAM